MDSTPIRDLGPEELKAELAAMGEPAYRAGQILRWLYRKGARDFAAMSDLPAGLRERLAARFPLAPPTVGAVLTAPDGTEKAALVFPDGCRVETVFIPAGERGTACLST